jgi:HAD superfamily phosphatase (TIGR01668 family)
VGPGGGLPPTHLYVRSVFDVDFTHLRDRGVMRGILLDVDNTLVPPRSNRVSQELVNHLRLGREASGIERWALASNTRRDLSALSTAIDIDVVKAGWLIAKPRKRYYLRALAKLDMRPHEVAMIGDKALHDILPAARLGLHTVLVHPAWPDQLIDRLLMRRQREGRLACVKGGFS